MKKYILPFLALIVIPLQTYAVCPVCTIAVVAGIGLSEKLGIDDAITGLWIGGLTVSMIMWTINWFNTKNFHFKGRIILTTICYYALIVAPLYFVPSLKQSVWHPLNTMLGMNKLLLGIVLGSISFFACAQWYEVIKKKNNGHAHFPFQKVVMPISPLVIFSFLLYFIIKYHVVS